jgi:L-lactate dehydrogenase complex protein LldG
MKISSSKENIFKKIRKALSQSTPLPFPKSEGNSPIFEPSSVQELEVEFAEQFNALQGRFIYCVNRQELAFQFNSLIKKQNWKKIFCAEKKLLELVGSQLEDNLLTNDLADCDISITSCECLVARTGSIVMSAANSMGRTASVYAPIHICIAFSNQLVYDVKDALQLIKEKYKDKLPSLITFATGPSRTADIEKTLVVGVHGPKEVYCFLVDV